MMVCVITAFSMIFTYVDLTNNNTAATATAQESHQDNHCIIYDQTKKTITISCSQPVHLSDIYNSIQNPQVLNKENDSNSGIWILNSTILVDKNAYLVIDKNDATWLKILAGIKDNNLEVKEKSEKEKEKEANSITVLGSLKIDSVKVSSWDPQKNDYIKFQYDLLPDREHEHTGIDAIPRPFINVDEETSGTTNITNSEMAYLGYECGGGCSGISYYGSNGTSIIKNNEIHHNRFGFYSVGVGNVILEGNIVHDNFMYGFDPHTGTHNMLIKNNTVYNHGAMGIICSLNCYNMTIEDNEVYDSAGSGIMFSRNMTDSVARNNNIHDEVKCIFLSQSSYNLIYNNKISNCADQGVYLYHNSLQNKVYNNALVNATEGIEESEDSKGSNSISDNKIIAAASAAG